MKEKYDRMVTFSGVVFHPLDPKPEEIKVVDIAHGLSNVCRFGGHTRVFYSVAEHSVRVAHWLAKNSVNGEAARWALVHDAAEAYLGDVIRPLKGFFPAYRVVEEKVLKAVVKKLGLSWPMPAEVKKADNILMACEARDLMHAPCGDGMPEKSDPMVGKIEPMLPGGAEFAWIREFKRFFLMSVEEADRG